MEKIINRKYRYIIYLFIAQAIFMLVNLYINYKVEKLWYLEGFATYNLLKRLAGFMVFPLVLGVGIGIPRYISFLKKDNKTQSVEYLLAGLFIFCITFCFFLISIIIFPELILSSFDTNYSNNIIYTVALFVFSQGVFVIISSFYRGKVEFGKSSLLNIVVLSILPVTFIFFVRNIFEYFLYYAISSILVLIGILIYNVYKNSISYRRTKLKVKRLIKYGTPRVVGDSVLFSLDFLPIYFVSIYISLEESGYLSLSFMFFKLAAVSFELIGSLILPVYGKIFKNELPSVFVKKVNSIIIISSLAAIVGSLIVYFTIPFLIKTFFSSLSPSILATQYVFIVFPFYVIFTMLKNILDIISVKAYNSIILMGGFMALITTLFYGLLIKEWFYYRALTIIVPYLVLGILTFIVWTRLKYRLLNNSSNI